jgi:HAE1 family hydrophobic/amphiphilic exporter-1
MGQQIKLNQFATVTGSGPSQLERRDKTASVTVKGQNVGFHPERSVSQWEEKSINQKTYRCRLHLGRTEENETEGLELWNRLLAAIILVYLVMVSLYDSFVHPFVVLFAIPLSLSLIGLGFELHNMNIFYDLVS